jgi:uncharacterized membrane protein
VTLDLALLSFAGTNGAVLAFDSARERSSPPAAWVRQVGFVEHHRNGHLVLRGTFAGHYIDIDEAIHVSQRGAAEGWAIGGVIGVLGGPIGLVIGMVLGGVVGSQIGKPSEVDPEPEALADELRAAVPRGSSAMVVIAAAQDVDALLHAVDDARAHITRKTLTPNEAAALQASLSDAPEASAGPFTEGEEAADASKGSSA